VAFILKICSSVQHENGASLYIIRNLLFVGRTTAHITFCIMLQYFVHECLLSFSSGCIISYHTYFQQNNQLLWFSFSAVLLADSSYLPDRRSSREAIYRAGRGNSESLGLGLIPQFDPIKTRVTFR